MIILNSSLRPVTNNNVSGSMVEIPLPVTAPLVAVIASDVQYGPSSASELVKPIVISPEITGCVNALFDALMVCGYSARAGRSQLALASQRAFDSTCNHWQRCANEVGDIDGWMKFVKYKTASFFFYHTRQKRSPPPVPAGITNDNPKLIASGTAGRFAHRILTTKKRWYFLNSILQLKKGCPRPSKLVVDKQIASTIKALTTERPEDKRVQALISWEDLAIMEDNKKPLLDKIENVLSVDTMKAQLRRTVDELFKDRSFTDRDRYLPYFPSTSASFTDSIKQGGSFRTIRKLVEELGLNTNVKAMSPSPDNIVNIVDEFKDEDFPTFTIRHSHIFRGHTVVERPEFKADVQVYEERLRDVTLRDRVRETIKQDGQSLVRFSIVKGDEYIGAPQHVYKADVTDLELRFGELHARALEKAMLEPAWVKPIGLAESLKVRVITKGPPLTSFVLKPLQKYMWKTLKSHPTFKLIGQPVDVDYLQERLGAPLRDGEYYLSGDYSAATDNLAPWVSETIALRIATHAGFKDEETALLLRALTRHYIQGEGDELLRQTWGQLMGSVVSFPILCIANAAFCRWALELCYNRTMKLSQTTLMVNGDDCACRITMPGVEYWERITTFGGLTPSIGKYFVSDEFVNINSTNFERLSEPNIVTVPHWNQEALDDGVVRMVDREIFFSESQYLNLGLLYGLKRSGELVNTHDIADETMTVGARCRDLIAHTPKDLEVMVWKLFKSHHKTLLDDIEVPYFAPESWGGVGLPLIHNEDGTIAYGPSDIDLRVAHIIQSNPDLYPVGKLPVTTTWNIHKYIMSHMPKARTNEISMDGGKSYDRVYGQMAVDAMFASAQPFSEKKNVYGRSVLRQNTKSWSKALKHGSGNLPPPLSVETLFKSDPPAVRPLFDIESLHYID